MVINDVFPMHSQVDTIAGVEAVFDRVVLRRDDPYKKYKEAGLEIPETAFAERPVVCTVLGIGPDCTIKILEGDQVLVGKYAGTEVEIWDERILIIRESEILCKIKAN